MKGIQSNGFLPIIAQAIAEMEELHGEFAGINEINLAELGRRTGISRAKLRRLKANGFCETPHGLIGQPKEHLLDGYSSVLDNLLRNGVSNSTVCLGRLQAIGFSGSRSTVKRYIASHKHLIPAKRQQIAPQGNRGRRYTTGPGENYQMDWGFTDVLDYNEQVFRVACFAMICHHCGECYIEFFPNAKQENLFIGMIHAFQYMGIPRFILTDNMKSVILHRDLEGHPVWQKDYETFMKTIGFETKLCKPRHPFTKGKVERLAVREREFPRRQSFLQHYRSKLARTGMVQFTERNLPSCRGRCASATPHGGMRRTASAASRIGRGTLLSLSGTKNLF